MDKHFYCRIAESNFSVVVDAEWYPEDGTDEVAIDWSLNELSGLESWCHFDGCFSIPNIDGWDMTVKHITNQLSRHVGLMESAEERTVKLIEAMVQQ